MILKNLCEITKIIIGNQRKLKFSKLIFSKKRFISNNWNKANIKYPIDILNRITFLSLNIFVEIILKIDPPKFVKPWNNPKIFSDRFIFLNLIFLFLKFLRFKIEKNIKKTDTIKTKLNLSWIYSIIINPKIKKGILCINIFIPNSKFWYLDSNIWRKLITIEYGNNIFKTSKKLYPSNKKVGVPNNNNPTPRTDWIKQNKLIIIISIKFTMQIYHKI